MEKFFSKYLSLKNWIVDEKTWHKMDQGSYESRFAQGNGIFGTRGILEEVPLDATPGTFIAGHYDGTNAQQTDLVNFPNPIHFKITAKGEKIGVAAMDFLEHERQLDMRHGLLARRTVYEDSRKRRFDYQSMRFVSMKDKNLLAFRIYLTPLDHDAEITVKSDIDLSTENTGVLTEGHKRHYQIVHVYQSDKYDYVCVKTLEKERFVAFVSCTKCQVGNKSWVVTDHAFDVKLKKRQTICFTKYITILPSAERVPGLIEKEALEHLEKNVKRGFEALVKDQAGAMKRLWATSDISVQGNEEIQRGIRFNIYHMLICAPFGEGRTSIGPKTLSGEGYRGHVFWDTEIFLFPFFLLTQPQIAKNILLYRYYRLNAARANAEKNHFKGAQFPWESADDGSETTPDWAKNYNGSIIKVRTGELEHHITADVAYAVYNYFVVTGDEDFMLKYGHEMLAETARFWASRAVLNKKKRKYDILHVIGPDEFHEDVNNNAYTNIMAKWNLLTAYQLMARYKREHRVSYEAMTRRIKLKAKEITSWKKIGAHLAVNVRGGVIEQFEDFFKKHRIKITKYDKHGMPDFPVGLDLSKISKTQFLKQADVLLLMYLLSNNYKPAVKKKNYDYYEPRTLHKSSLSPSIHAIMATEMGDEEKAAHYFKIALFMDFKDIYKNTKDGIHAACLGGAWQAVVNGFGGVRFEQNMLSLNPKIPSFLKQINFTLFWRGNRFKFQMTSKAVKIKCSFGERHHPIRLRVSGKAHELKGKRFYQFRL